jgi:pyrroline-5-carboxylate reductase
MKNDLIAFIGGGNIASSLIGGLISERYPADRIRVADPDQAQRDKLRARFGIETFADNLEAIKDADVVVMAVKPQVLQVVASALKPGISEPPPLFISVAAGIPTAALAEWLGAQTPVIRAMPNTPALVSSGATALFASARVDSNQHDVAETIMRSVGVTTWVDDEALMDVVTALSGSGPAYFFLVMEALENAAVKRGLPADTAHILTLQTALGAAKMALESEEEVASLRHRVTSPGGTTEEAIKSFEKDDIQGMFERAVNAANERAKELARVLGGK